MDGPDPCLPWSGVPPETELGTTVELVLPHRAYLLASHAAASGRTGCRGHWTKHADSYRTAPKERRRCLGTRVPKNTSLS
jgi:hypothetical protein